MYRNATHAFLGELSRISSQGKIITVRGNEIKERQSVLIQIANPLERVYLVPRRNNNIFACIAETLWVISGRNDLTFLSHYLPRAIEFSDDGMTWRAGYGPRLRNWHGVDQIREVARILSHDRQSRRAVMIIFDPEVDFAESKDIPCNNWLSFIIREDSLHMNVAIRSNDIVWGFSGVNTFEWSVLQEMMAFWTGSNVGTLNIFVSSLHLYSRHYARAAEMIGRPHQKTLYEFEFLSSRFQTPITKFDDEIQKWFSTERKIREGVITSVKAIEDLIEDGFLRNCAQMMVIYALYRNKANESDLVNELKAMPSNDFRIAAIEYLVRNAGYQNVTHLLEMERKFFDYYITNNDPSNQALSKPIENILTILRDLHYKKTLVYKDSWKKHGEVIGVFANITRKYDRIESIFIHGSKTTSDETLIDTLSDLAIYTAKYLTLLAETYPDLFAKFLGELGIMENVQDYGKTLDGFDLVIALLKAKQEVLCQQTGFTSYEECFSGITKSYKALETILLYEDWRMERLEKCYESANLALASIHYLLLISQNDPVEFAKFAELVAQL